MKPSPRLDLPPHASVERHYGCVVIHTSIQAFVASYAKSVIPLHVVSPTRKYPIWSIYRTGWSNRSATTTRDPENPWTSSCSCLQWSTSIVSLGEHVHVYRFSIAMCTFHRLDNPWSQASFPFCPRSFPSCLCLLCRVFIIPTNGQLHQFSIRT